MHWQLFSSIPPEPSWFGRLVLHFSSQGVEQKQSHLSSDVSAAVRERQGEQLRNYPFTPESNQDPKNTHPSIPREDENSDWNAQDPHPHSISQRPVYSAHRQGARPPN
jgi:hypothetical protein